MNLPTILISLVLVALLVLAVRFLVKNGTCATCAEKSSCHTASCGDCSSCRGCSSKTTSSTRH